MHAPPHVHSVLLVRSNVKKCALLCFSTKKMYASMTNMIMRKTPEACESTCAYDACKNDVRSNHFFGVLIGKKQFFITCKPRSAHSFQQCGGSGSGHRSIQLIYLSTVPIIQKRRNKNKETFTCAPSREKTLTDIDHSRAQAPAHFTKRIEMSPFDGKRSCTGEESRACRTTTEHEQ